MRKCLEEKLKIIIIIMIIIFTTRISQSPCLLDYNNTVLSKKFEFYIQIITCLGMIRFNKFYFHKSGTMAVRLRSDIRNLLGFSYADLHRSCWCFYNFFVFIIIDSGKERDVFGDVLGDVIKKGMCLTCTSDLGVDN